MAGTRQWLMAALLTPGRTVGPPDSCWRQQTRSFKFTITLTDLTLAYSITVHHRLRIYHRIATCLITKLVTHL